MRDTPGNAIKQSGLGEGAGMKTIITRFLREEDGATAIEYGLIAGLIAAAIIVNIGSIGTQLQAIFNYVNTQLATAKTS